MLVLMQILRCGSGRQKEALKRLHWIHGLMSERADSGGCIVAKHLGNPIDLLILRMWQTQEAMLRRTSSYYQDRWPLFPPNEPEGIYQTQDIAHHWDEALRLNGASDGDFIWRSTFKVPRDRWEEFLELRREDDALIQKTGGLVLSSTLRNVEDEEGALVLLRLRDRQVMEDVVVDPKRVVVETRIKDLASPLDYPELNVFHSECFEVADEFVR